MNTKINVVTSDIKKVSVTITRRALWDNFVLSWKDLAWDSFDHVEWINRVAIVLVGKNKIHTPFLRKLFRDGDTCMLMGEAMNHLDTGNEIHREIIVDDDGEKHVIRHEDINF